MPIPVLLVVALAPLGILVLATPVPPLLDYPNHLVRFWLLAGGAERPTLAEYYAADWSNAFTNSATDALAVAIAPLLGGAEPAARFMLALALVLPAFGAALLNRSVFGRWSVWQLAFPIFALNGILIAGFVSFLIGIGLAFALAATEPRLARRGAALRSATRAVFGILLLSVHALGLALYIALVAGIAFGPLLDVRPAAWARAAWRAAQATLPVVTMAVLALLLSGAPGPWDNAASESPLLPSWTGYAFFAKVQAFTTAIATYDVLVELPMVLAVMATARWSLARGCLERHGGLLVVAGGLAALTIVMPNTLGGTGWMDRRFPIMALLTFMAALRPKVPSQRGLVIAGLLGLCVVRSGWVGWIWHERQADIAAVERALAPVPPGAALLTALETPETRWSAPVGRYFPRGQMPTYEHVGTFAVIRREAFVPTLFALRGRHTLRVVPPWDEVSLPSGFGVAVEHMDNPVEAGPRPYLRDWRSRFRFLLVIDGDRASERQRPPPLPGLTLMTDEGFARLYRIGPIPAASPAHGSIDTDDPTPAR